MESRKAKFHNIKKEYKKQLREMNEKKEEVKEKIEIKETLSDRYERIIEKEMNEVKEEVHDFYTVKTLPQYLKSSKVIINNSLEKLDEKNRILIKCFFGYNTKKLSILEISNKLNIDKKELLEILKEDIFKLQKLVNQEKYEKTIKIKQEKKSEMDILRITSLSNYFSVGSTMIKDAIEELNQEERLCIKFYYGIDTQCLSLSNVASLLDKDVIETKDLIISSVYKLGNLLRLRIGKPFSKEIKEEKESYQKEKTKQLKLNNYIMDYRKNN